MSRRYKTREDAKRVADRDDHLQPTYPQIGRSVFLNPTTTRTGPGTVHGKSGRGVPRRGGRGGSGADAGFKTGIKRASWEANGRETRLLVWMPHIFWGSIWLGFLGRGAAFWNWEREPHDKQGLASLRTGRDDDYTLDDLFLFPLLLLPSPSSYDIKKAS